MPHRGSFRDLLAGIRQAAPRQQHSAARRRRWTTARSTARCRAVSSTGQRTTADYTRRRTTRWLRNLDARRAHAGGGDTAAARRNPITESSTGTCGRICPQRTKTSPAGGRRRSAIPESEVERTGRRRHAEAARCRGHDHRDRRHHPGAGPRSRSSTDTVSGTPNTSTGSTRCVSRISLKAGPEEGLR